MFGEGLCETGAGLSAIKAFPKKAVRGPLNLRKHLREGSIGRSFTADSRRHFGTQVSHGLCGLLKAASKSMGLAEELLAFTLSHFSLLLKFMKTLRGLTKLPHQLALKQIKRATRAHTRLLSNFIQRIALDAVTFTDEIVAFSLGGAKGLLQIGHLPADHLKFRAHSLGVGLELVQEGVLCLHLLLQTANLLFKAFDRVLGIQEALLLGHELGLACLHFLHGLPALLVKQCQLALILLAKRLGSLQLLHIQLELLAEAAELSFSTGTRRGLLAVLLDGSLGLANDFLVTLDLGHERLVLDL